MKNIIHAGVYATLQLIVLILSTIYPVLAGGVLIAPILYIVAVLGVRTYKEFGMALNDYNIHGDNVDEYLLEHYSMGVAEGQVLIAELVEE